jgi:DinB family protein
MTRLDLALEQIVTVRRYTTRLLDNIRPEDWFRMPPGEVTHIAWQVGHISFGQLRLALIRTRGPRLDDERVFPAAYEKLFGRTTVPDADAGKYPAVTEIREVFVRVHQRVLEEVPKLPEADLDDPVAPPHTVAKTKFESLLWCAQHEMVHAGQIGLIRRQLGYAPLW